MVVVVALRAWEGSWRWRPGFVGVESYGEGLFIGRPRRRGGGAVMVAGKLEDGD